MKKMVITISRQYASGGRMIGQELARELGIGFYDKKLLNIAAEKSGFSPEALEQAEDKASNSLLYALSAGLSAGVGMSINDQFFLAQFDAIKQIAAEGPSIIVGRCADYILRDMENSIHIFIHADMPSRIERAVNEYGVPCAEVQAKIQKADKARTNYYAHYTTRKWGDAKNYHLTVDSGMLGITKTVDLLKNYIGYFTE